MPATTTLTLRAPFSDLDGSVLLLVVQGAVLHQRGLQTLR